MGRAPADFPAGSGDPAWVRYDLERVMLFDARTELRVER